MLAGSDLVIPLDHPVVKHNDEITMHSILERMKNESEELRKQLDEGKKQRNVISVLRRRTIMDAPHAGLSAL